MQTSTIEATWRGIDGRAQEGWYDVRLTHRLVDAAGETILPAGRIAAGRLSEREDEPSVTLTVPAADVDDTAEWFLVVYISFEERRTSETYALEPVAPGEVIDLALQVPVADVPDGFASGTVVRGIDGKDGRGIESVDLDGDALVFTYDDGTLEFVTVEGGFGGGGDTEPGAPARGIESLTQVDEVTLVVTFTDETTQTLTLPRGADGDDADPLTITGDRLADDGDVVLTFSDGSEVVIPGGRDAAPLTVDGYTFNEGGHTVVTFSDGSEAVVQRGPRGYDADALTVTGERLTDDGNTVVIFSDGSEVTVPGGADGEDGKDFTFADFTPEQLEALRGPRGRDGASLTVEHVQEVADGLRVTFSDNTSMTVPRGGDGQDAAPLTVEGFTFDEAGNTVVTFSDGSEVVVPRGEDGDDGATPHVGPGGNWWVGDTNTGVRARGPAGESFTFADFTPEQLEALRGPRGYAGRGVESITDEDGDGVATVTYSDGETSDLPLPAGGGGDGGGGFDLDAAGVETFVHLAPFFREVMLEFDSESNVNYQLAMLEDIADEFSPAFASFMLPAYLTIMERQSSGPGGGGGGSGGSARGVLWYPGNSVSLDSIVDVDADYFVKVTLTDVSDMDHEVLVSFAGKDMPVVTVPAGGEVSETYLVDYGAPVVLVKTDGSQPGDVLYTVEAFPG